jgi:hypothetical protein
MRTDPGCRLIAALLLAGPPRPPWRTGWRSSTRLEIQEGACHQDAAAVALEETRRIAMQISPIVEARAAVLDHELEPIAELSELHLDSLVAMLRRGQPPRDLVIKATFLQ